MTNTYQTEISKGFRGWNAETMVNNINDYDWNITTSKWDRKGIVCTAQACKETEHGFEVVLFQDPSITLCEVQKRGTEKTIKEVHEMGLVKFQKLIESGELPSRESSE